MPDSRCPKCGAFSPPGDLLGGACPACLLKLALSDSVAGADREPGEVTRLAADTPMVAFPARIGPYRIVSVLGAGGMGIVYLAEQDEPIRRRVALKVIKAGMDTREVVRRFESERQALALMSHPNIARVLDAGSTKEGRPYFVMEHVPGVPITEYCDRHRLSNRDRLALFVPICLAVQHAHQRGIVHRDLKPSNVLVGVEDGTPVPKVIDFGIAKAIHQPLIEEAVFTRHGVLIGTPEYMSPEQAARGGLEIDTTSDVYSLGVILYELLTGALPFDPDRLRRAAYDELLRVIREEPPARPSVRVTMLGAGGNDVAERRRTDLPALERQLRSELDWIALKAMDKDRARRYPSASELAADIERHLHDEPVAASPPSAAYRLGKTVRKHRVGVAAACAVFLSLAGGLVTSTWLYRRSEAARERAEMQATRNRVDAEAMEAALREDRPAYERLSNEAIALHRRALGPGNPALAPYLVNYLAFDLLLPRNGRPPSAGQLKEATTLIERALDAGDAGAVKTLLVLRDHIGDEDETELPRLCQKAFNLLRNSSADAVTTEELGLLADLLEMEGTEGTALDTRERLARDVLELRRKIGAPNAPKLAFSLTRLADILAERAAKAWKSGQVTGAAAWYGEAASLVHESLPAIADRTDRSTAERRQVELETEVALCIAALGRFQEAEGALKRSLEASRPQETKERGATTELALNGLVDLYDAWGKPREAAAYRARLGRISLRTVRDLGTVRAVPRVFSRQGGTSASLDGRSVWVFRETTVRRLGESQGAGSSWSVMRASADNDSLELRPPASDGASPLGLLQTTAEEIRDGIHLDPGAVAWDRARRRALVFYNKRQGEGDRRRHLGTSIALWPAMDARATRPSVSGGVEGGRLLFDGEEPTWGSAALAVGDWLYVYGEHNRACCRLARVPLARVLDRSAWRFYAGSWVREWERGWQLLDGDGFLSVGWNAYLGKYLAVNAASISSQINVRTADRPEGPWSQKVLVEGLPSTGVFPWINSASAHSELSRDGGRFELVTYSRGFGNGRSEMRAVEIEFRKR